MVGSPSGDNSRKISFAVLGERSDSIHSSTTSISMMDPSVSPNIHSDDKKGTYMVYFCLKFFGFEITMTSFLRRSCCNDNGFFSIQGEN